MHYLVVGAGLAGLAAAERLVAAGCRVTLLEARDRPGGRAWSVGGRGEAPIELGAEWIADRGVVRDLCRTHGIPLASAEGRFWRRGRAPRDGHGGQADA